VVADSPRMGCSMGRLVVPGSWCSNHEKPFLVVSRLGWKRHPEDSLIEASQGQGLSVKRVCPSNDTDGVPSEIKYLVVSPFMYRAKHRNQLFLLDFSS